VLGVFTLIVVIFVALIFIWAAKRDGEEDLAIQKRLGIKRKTRLGR
jgi:hypothetical protein